jgi:hypothetical protein
MTKSAQPQQIASNDDPVTVSADDETATLPALAFPQYRSDDAEVLARLSAQLEHLLTLGQSINRYLEQLVGAREDMPAQPKKTRRTRKSAR